MANAFQGQDLGLFFQQLLGLLPLIEQNPDAVAQAAAEKAAPPPAPAQPDTSAVGQALIAPPKDGQGPAATSPFPDLGAIGKGIQVPATPQAPKAQPIALAAPSTSAAGATNTQNLQLLLQLLQGGGGPQFRSLGEILGGVK